MNFRLFTYIVSEYSGYIYITFEPSAYANENEVKEVVSGTLLAYPLTTPYEIQLDPITIKTLLGDNTIWSDANGDIELEYRADTKLFVNNNNPVTDVKINGSSILDAQGVANVPTANSSTLGVVQLYDSAYGLEMNNGKLRTSPAGSSHIKSASNAYRPITTDKQHDAVFYGLAKATGDTSQTSSSNPVGQFPPEAIVAIQKMLGVYQAPWELIREETGTNDTESSIIVSVDGDGQPFELTDVRVLLEFPKVDAIATTNDYAKLYAYYQGTSKWLTLEGGSTLSRTTASDSAKGVWYFIEQRDGMLYSLIGTPATSTNMGAMRTRYIVYDHPTSNDSMGIKLTNDFSIHMLEWTKIVGTYHYRIYGKRKWTT